jgi:hypothetical protein
MVTSTKWFEHKEQIGDLTLTVMQEEDGHFTFDIWLDSPDGWEYVDGGFNWSRDFKETLIEARNIALRHFVCLYGSIGSRIHDCFRRAEYEGAD